MKKFENEWTRKVEKLQKVNGELLEALKELADWPFHSLCFDGTKAKRADESLANARRFARAAIAVAEK